MENPNLPDLPLAAVLLFPVLGIRAPYVYRYAEERWWLTDCGLEYWVFSDADGVRVVENPFC
jgi:hypothetical protein